MDAYGDHYLAPSELDPFEPDTMGFLFDELTKMIDKSTSQRIVTILDCCYSGAAKIGKGVEEDAANAGRKVIDEKSRILEHGEGKCILAASQAYQKAFETTQKDHSLFTHYLIEGLRGNEETVDSYGYVTPDLLSRYVYNKIMSLPPEQKPAQKPITKVQQSGDIVLAYYPQFSKAKGEDSVSDTLSQEIKKAASLAKTEEDLKLAVQPLIHSALQELGVSNLTPRYEKKIYESRRVDVLYSAVALEYKKPHGFNHTSVLDDAIKKLKDSLKGLSKSENVSRRYVGIGLDGYKIVFLRARAPAAQIQATNIQTTIEGSILLPSTFEEPKLSPVNRDTIQQLLTCLRQLNRRTLDAELLSEDFGNNSKIGKDYVKLFHTLLCKSTNPKTNILFKEWSRIFGIVYGEKIVKSKEADRLAGDYNITENIDMKSILFSIHTYFALLMKMIAAEVLTMQYEGLLSSFAKNWSDNYDDILLKKDFFFLESGRLFKKFGITNFLEGDFFSWYLEEWNADISRIIRDIAKKLNEYEPATPRLENDQVKDLLKKLYQYLVPKAVRHDLGEYYTPDWLASYLLDRTDYDGDPVKRVLDPACGSGTFLTLILKKIISFVQSNPKSESDVLKHVLTNVISFDINPVAVLAARTNYLIAISPLRRFGEDEIELPIYFTDSIMTPRTHHSLNGEVYTLKTAVGDFIIPKIISEKETVSLILDSLYDKIGYNGKESTFLEDVRSHIGNDLFVKVEGNLRELFNQMDRLNKEKVDHIWSRIIKNNIVSSSVGKFDYVIGNPPWIRWGYMLQDYRNATLELWKKYGLFSLKGMMARLGSGEKDFSMLFLYTCADNYLKVGGTLGFLITQEVIKSKGAGEGFRRFELGNTKMYLKVKEFHDFVTIEQYIYTVICIKSSQKAVKPPPKLGLICKEWPRQGNQPIIHPSICVSEGLFYRTFFSDERLAADAAAAATHQPIHLWTFEITTIYIV